MNINLDTKTLEQCLKTIDNFGNTVYVNICSGKSYTISWGSMKWLPLVLLIALCVGLGLGLTTKDS